LSSAARVGGRRAYNAPRRDLAGFRRLGLAGLLGLVTRRYSYLEHIAGMLYRVSLQLEIVMFTAYFDAAGKAHRPGMISIAGFVSDAKKWAQFEIEWGKILARESIALFHMADFVSSQGEFKEWKGQPDRRKKFIADLLACAKRYTNKAFGGAIVLRDYRRVNQLYQLREYAGSPYPLCGHYCVRMVKAWQAKNRIKNVVLPSSRGMKTGDN
jgi:hypothetical protein